MASTQHPAPAVPLRVGLVGCGWICGVYADSFAEVPDAQVVACCAGHPERARAFADARGIPHACASWEELVAREDVDLVAVGSPNRLHHPVAMAALAAGKHVVVEKPLAVTLEQCQQIADEASARGLLAGYAENLCFAPKYEKVRDLITSGELGRVHHVRQLEKHGGPHTRWFYEDDAAGGALFDMGCHSIELVRWLLGKPAVTAVWAHMATVVHDTELDDHCVIHLEFASPEGSERPATDRDAPGPTALLEAGWSLEGGMVSDLHVQGTAGVASASLLGDGMGLRAFTERGEERGWRAVDVDWHRANGYPQQLAHFVRCARTGETPIESAADGVAVMEFMLAAYESAGTGRKVSLPFRPAGVARPVDLWKRPRGRKP